MLFNVLSECPGESGECPYHGEDGKSRLKVSHPNNLAFSSDFDTEVYYV